MRAKSLNRLGAVLLAAGLTLAGCADDAAPDASDDAAAAELRAHAIEARRGLMAEMSVQMLEIDKAAGGDPFDLREGRVRAGAVAAMLNALPPLYVEGTDWESAGEETPSLALPAIWEDREAFERMVSQVSTRAFELVAIPDETVFRQRAAEVRAGCNACHAAYQQGYAEAS